MPPSNSTHFPSGVCGARLENRGTEQGPQTRIPSKPIRMLAIFYGPLWSASLSHGTCFRSLLFHASKYPHSIVYLLPLFCTADAAVLVFFLPRALLKCVHHLCVYYCCGTSLFRFIVVIFMYLHSMTVFFYAKYHTSKMCGYGGDFSLTLI